MATERVDWEQVWQGTGEVEATLVAGRLNAEGFRTMVRGHHMPQRTIAFLKGSFGVAVPAEVAESARDALRRNGQAHNIIEPETGTGLTGTQKETLGFIVLGLLLATAVGLALAIRNGA